MRGPCRAVEFGPAGQAAIDHDRDAIQSERGFGDGRGEDDTPPPFGIAPYGRALARRIDLSVQRQDHGVGQARFDAFAHALDLAHAGQKGENVALLVAPCGRDSIGDRILHPLVGRAAHPFDRQREGAPLALDNRGRIAEQPRESRAVDRRRHDEDAQILTHEGAALQRHGEAEIAVEMALMRFVEQHCRHAGQFRIFEDAIDEDRFGHDENARLGRLATVEPGEVADGFARLLAQLGRHPFRRRARRDPARAGEDDLTAAPVLPDQGWCHRRRLARPRRRDQHRAGLRAQGRQKIRQYGVDGKVGRHRPALFS